MTLVCQPASLRASLPDVDDFIDPPVVHSVSVEDIGAAYPDDDLFTVDAQAWCSFGLYACPAFELIFPLVYRGEPVTVRWRVDAAGCVDRVRVECAFTGHLAGKTVDVRTIDCIPSIVVANDATRVDFAVRFAVLIRGMFDD